MITNENKEEVSRQVEEVFTKKAKEVAEDLGITIGSISTNIGGFKFQEGEMVDKQVRELSFTFELNTQDTEKADIFASIMGDLGYEQQESVISYNRVENEDSADALSIKVKVNDTEGIADIIERSGITDYTFNETKGEITLLAFSKKKDEYKGKLETLINNLGEKYNDTEYEYIRSKYLDRRTREETYKAWRKERGLSEGEDNDLHSTAEEREKRLKDLALSVQKGSKDADYKQYLEENQAGIAHYEAFTPIYSDDLAMFSDEKGNISIKALEMLDPKLLEMICYKIPTEDGYSIFPVRSVGFMPREAGDAIMFPEEITAITGTDFDIDKENTIKRDIRIKKKNLAQGERKEMRKGLLQIIAETIPDIQKEDWKEIGDIVNTFLSSPFNMANTVGDSNGIYVSEETYDKMLERYVKTMFTTEYPVEGRTAVNNELFDMSYEALTHESMVTKQIDAQNFDQQKRMGYMVDIFKHHSGEYTWEQLQGMSINELKDLSNRGKNIAFIDVQTQLYKQNRAGSNLIGIIFASIMGDLGYEQQEAVISYNRVEDVDSADALAIKVRVNDIEGIADIIEASGITGYMFNETQKEITLLSFSKDEAEFGDKIKTLINKLGDKCNGTEKRFIQSRYLAKEDRERTYKAWLKERGLSEGEDNDLHSTAEEREKRLKDLALSVQKGSKDADYKKYLKENQAGIAYYEAFTPIYSDDLAMFSDEKGNISIKALEMLNPKLLEMICYKIPTEDGYSIFPVRSVGFMPREAGDAIMFPEKIIQ